MVIARFEIGKPCKGGFSAFQNTHSDTPQALILCCKDIDSFLSYQGRQYKPDMEQTEPLQKDSDRWSVIKSMILDYQSNTKYVLLRYNGFQRCVCFRKKIGYGGKVHGFKR
ncbi:hypothetical protein [Parablautia muri]|uniref:Uncharacterized protein n=1 Tax=Parablautia muri TaxID=2320879 RepID=A0A9X5BFR4_9FIRM|nr:hypothetical protein [Parablautia muri]NBJ92990.1 hypothetical protein [Parablautia muri]